MKKKSSEIAHRYALALFELAREGNQLVEVLESFRRVVALDDEVLSVFASPRYADEEKLVLLEKVIEVLKTASVLADTLRLVLKNRRFGLVREMAVAFQELVDASTNVCRGAVISAQPIDPADLASLEAALAQALGKQVFLAPKIDEHLEAGYVVRVGSLVIDASLKTQLGNLRESLNRGVW